MTDTARPGGRARWIVAAVLAAVAVALLVVLLTVLVPDRHDAHRSKDNVGLTTSEQAAVDAASKQVVNLLTYSRKSFEADYARAEAGATGALKTDLASDTKKSTLLQQMTAGKFDLQGIVSATALEESSGSTFAVLVSAQGYKVPDGAARTLTSTARFEITMTHTGSSWLASNLQTIGLI